MKINNVILITGGSSNLGAIISARLSRGGNLVYSGFNSKKNINKVKNIIPIKLDITNNRSVKSAVGEIVKKSGRIDVLINCAGITKVGRLENSTIEDFDQLLEINTKGAYRIIREVLPIMKKQKSGNIINITSMSGLISLPNFGIYSASKFALEAFTTALRYELLKDKIWVTNIEPGAIKSDSKKKVIMTHKTFREKYLLARLILPLVSVNEVSNKVFEILAMSHPPLNIMIGRDVKLTYLAKKILPAGVWDKLIRTALT